MKLFIFSIFASLCFLCPVFINAETITGHFNRLPLMKDQASKDDDDRAMVIIDYIWETPDGEYFKVDNEDLLIESIIYKIDKTKQHKPLQKKNDEDLIIYYYHLVEEYAKNYYPIVDGIVSGELMPNNALFNLEVLDANYPGFPATFRAMGAASFALGNTDQAVQWVGKAVSMNRNDTKALLLFSISEYAQLNKQTSLKYFKEAAWINPDVTSNFWEIEFIMEKEPKIYHEWSDYVGIFK